MLEFLKESTFKANDVIVRGLHILKRHYISIAGLCFLLFMTNNLSTFLAGYFDAPALGFVKYPLFILFVTLFFGLQLVLIKRAVLLAKGIERTELKNYIPTLKQFVNFLLGLVIYSFLSGVVYLLCSVLAWPLLYIGVNMETISYEINPLLTGFVMMLILIRISFFPFFILVNNFNIFRAGRLSVAFTKGNVIDLLVLMFSLASTYILQLTFEYLGYSLLATLSSVLNTFIVIPLVSLVLAIAYTDMIQEYKGSDNPELFKNII
ncbi:hypothetical protein G5B00_12855 [Parapedobacter sp. SGR-10]|uniref:hypothetical protein n=1 Tax=Parapedobacter sp. SGR-10 TaxID=2710879 RepID=UPI0013D1BB22|nr:hypothetical protein [Parapedobacter sp. SGR-10]NGF57401.1 hypothetical protein [Parapedobacter sp. SGR-10]